VRSIGAITVGHATQRAEQQRDRPAQSGDGMCSPGQQQQRGHRTVADQPPHRPADPGQFVEAQGQAALEQDQRHPQRHHRKQQPAKQLVRIEHAAHRPQQYPHQQQEQDRRKLDPPGQPLRQKAGHQQGGEHQTELDSHQSPQANINLRSKHAPPPASSR
jgi:hypothetical protein